MSKLQTLRQRAEDELLKNILPFHSKYMLDEERGGFHGYLSNGLVVDQSAEKGAVQCSRYLWTFARAYRLFGTPAYLRVADHAYNYLETYFYDDQYGGYYHALTPLGEPLNHAKRVYTQAFCLYGLTEYFRATGDANSLTKAQQLYALLESACRLPEQGYGETYSRDWEQRLDFNIDEVNVPAVATMNTHLHLMEAYTNLYAARANLDLRRSLRSLITLTTQKIFDPEIGHLRLHFSADWQPLTKTISYGHDIEASWLLWEAADAVGDMAILSDVHSVSLLLAKECLAVGVGNDGGLFNEGTAEGVTDLNRDWWPQAEAVVGFINAHRLSRYPIYLDAAMLCWNFIDTYLVDHRNGEWFWGVDARGYVRDEARAGFWKTPYHNARACMELLERIPKS